MLVNNQDPAQDENMPDMDMSKWVSFEMSSQGEISRVHYMKDEKMDVFTLKQILLGMLSSHLVVSTSHNETGLNWAYQVNETGPDGRHLSVYQAQPLKDKIVFSKSRQVKTPHNTNQKQTKVIHLDSSMQVPSKISMKEYFASPNKLSPTYKSLRPDKLESDDSFDVPPMSGSSTATMVLVTTDTNSTIFQHIEKPEELFNCSLILKQIPPSDLSLTASVWSSIRNNVTCIAAARKADLHLGIPCFGKLLGVLSRLDDSSLERVVTWYLTGSLPVEHQQSVIDALGAIHTTRAYNVMRKHIFRADTPVPELLMRALIQLVDLPASPPPPQDFLRTLENIAFYTPYNFTDEAVTTEVNDRVTLVLAAIAQTLVVTRADWASSVVLRLEQRLSVHDPYHHRQLRSTLSEEDLQRHLDHKTLHLLSLGNAARPSSRPIILSYLNASDTHIVLRCSAADALARFQGIEVAEMLLSLAMTDEEENVRLAAVNGYKTHPYGGDIRMLFDPIYRRSHNTTKAEHQRMRRSLKSTIKRIWQGFHFKLQSPSINWGKMIGGKKLGASFGLVIKNLLDIQISPLKSHLLVDILDKAFATIHVGLIGFDFDLFRAELCFKGNIGYDLNVLKEYGFDSIAKIADLYNNVVKKLIGKITGAVKSFKRLIASGESTDFRGIIEQLIAAVKQLPSKVLNLRRIGKRIYQAIGQFVELPPVVAKVKALVTKVSTLFKDIKTDVMTLYNAIADAVNTVIPWAWDEISEAFNGIGKAIKNIIKNPKSSMQNIGKSVVRISTAIAALIDAKNKIMDANIFAKDNRPYWFDIKKELKEIWDMVLAVKDSVKKSIDWLKNTDPAANQIAKRFTGLDLSTMKKLALNAIMKVVEEELEVPMKLLKQLLQPFVDAYNFFFKTINTIKEAWRLLLEGYRKGRTILEQIFGKKMHADFPRKYLESSSCGDGFYETDGKGHYEQIGVSLAVSVGHELIAPYDGTLKKSGQNQVTLELNHKKNVHMIITNIDMTAAAGLIGAGDSIGKVKSASWCSDDHIHLAMVNVKKLTVIDPSIYIRKRDMPRPKWVQECDHYKLVWLGRTISQGSLLGQKKDEDKTPAISNAPPEESLDVGTIDVPKRRKRELNIFQKVNDFAKKLGFPDLSKLKELFNFNMNDLTVRKILDLLDKVGLSTLKNAIIKLLNGVETLTNRQSCLSPESMDDNELKTILTQRGKNAVGARQTLINRYLQSDPTCHGIGSRAGKGVYCRFNKACTSVSCCVDLKLFIFRHAVTAYVTYDPCTYELTLGINKWSHTLKILSHDFATEGTAQTVANINILNVVQLIAIYKVQRVKDVITVSLGVSFCSTRAEECQMQLSILAAAQIAVAPCDEDNVTTALTQQTDSPTVNAMLDMKITDVMKLMEMSDIDESVMVKLVEDLREAFGVWLKEQIKAMVVKLFRNEFDRFDICTTGLQKSFGPYYVEIYKLTPPYIIPIGPIPLQFKFGIDGHYGAKFHCTLCIMTMKATANVVPRLGSSVWGSVGVTIFVLSAELRLTGYLLTTSFPTKVVIEFHKFPLTVRARMDLVLIPLRIELRALLIFKFCIWLPWVGKKCWKKTLINFLIWHYQSKTIEKNIFNLNNAEKDYSPPDFAWYGKAKCKKCKKDDEKDEKKKDKKGGRRRRAVGGEGSCVITQVSGRDHTEPAFFLEVAVSDDRSDTTLTYCIGTAPNSCDVVDGEPLAGGSSTLYKTMPTGVALFCTVTATNSMGLTSVKTCDLKTYDMTIPIGRASIDFGSTSHRSIITGSALVIDDSPIVTKKVSVGHGKDGYGWQLLDWQDTDSTQALAVDRTTDPLSQFSAARDGRLIASHFKSSRYMFVEPCASLCLSYSTLKCLSFNYDSDTGTCELLTAVEGSLVKLRMNGYFNHYERRGIGDVIPLRFVDLNLLHNTLTYVNLYLQNLISYENIISSRPLIVDFTPPAPGFGLIQNHHRDQTTDEDCKRFVPKLLYHRCQSEPSKANYRGIIDGKGSGTLFNGHEPLKDEKYTRSNRMIAANWDGIHDNETGIEMYTWAVGLSPCDDSIHPHKDPHAHLASASEWSHSAVAFPLDLADGKYHITLRAINKVEFNPLCLSVCHHLPYVIDNTPPVINTIDHVEYNELATVLTFQVNATDAESDIKSGEMGLGMSRRDTYLLDWVSVDNHTHITKQFKITDGVPTWVKMRVTNNVDLRAVSHADQPIIVDLSPPIAGLVYDGPVPGDDIRYQSSDTKLCCSWDGFHDPQSGIVWYHVGVGSGPDKDDVVAFTTVEYTAASHCFETLQLTHNSIYYVTVFAFNGGHVEKNSSSHSDGVTVDTTPPVKGWIKDGDTPDVDILYTSDPATVATHWDGFSDPESQLKDFELEVYRKRKGVETEKLIHTEADIAASSTSLSLHHFHLLHGDFVQMKLTATNNAEGKTSLRSDGFTVDLTDPILQHLVDGPTLSKDMQYTDSTTELVASWDFKDEESSIDHYKLSAYEQHAGARTQIYPTTSKWKVIVGTVKTWTSNEALTLKIGARYTVRVSAMNGAGLTAVHETNGVIVDPTPPTMTYVHAGVLNGESEELIDGYVLHNDPDGIKASWGATDLQSGIVEYLVAIGTSIGASDVLDFQSLGLAEDGYISGLSLTLTDKVTLQPVYYVTVKAINGAGKSSTTKTSNPIKVLEGDKAGVVADGPTAADDIDFQRQTATATQTFTGFESERDGIVHYLWAVGSKPCWDDVLSFSPAALLISQPLAAQTHGLGGEGKGQAVLPLSAAHKYYACVRAITGANNVLESATDGFTVDVTPARIAFTSVGAEDIGEETPSSLIYQREDVSFTAHWTAEDDESGVVKTQIRLGTYPDGEDIASTRTQLTSIQYGDLRPASPGLPNFLTVLTENKVSLSSHLSSPVLTVDTSQPAEGHVSCPHFVQGGSTIECSWSGFLEAQSEVEYYLFGVGRSEGDDSLYQLHRVNPPLTRHKAIGLKNGGLQHQVEYYVTVIAVNMVGLKTTAYSQKVVVDDTPPTGNLVIELSDVFVIDGSSQPADGAAADSTAETEVTIENDAKCQRSLVQVTVAWQPFEDLESKVVHYQVGLGSTAGGTQVAAFTGVPPGRLSLIVRGLDLSRVTQVFATVKAFNAAGLYSTVTSNGVYVSLVSSGMPSLRQSVVHDGDRDGDAEYQGHNVGLSAHWDLSGDPCPAASIQWAIHRFDGTIVMPMAVIPLGIQQAMYDEIQLRDGESYFIVLRVTNQLDFTYTLQSDGITIQLEPLLPGNVRDGLDPGVDLNFQASLSTLSANWDGFGQQKDLSNLDNDPSIDSQIGAHQEVEFYEVSAGTDRRHSDTRQNIHGIVNVGLNTTWTFEHLTLVAKRATYYVTVRAHSVSAASSEVISNGIKVGYGSKVISVGTIELPEFSSSTTSISFSWADFAFELPVQYYTWAIGKAHSDLDALICDDFKSSSATEKPTAIAALLDVKPLTKAASDTFVAVDGLSLSDGATYFVVVIATDQSGECTQATARFTVDSTAPTDGQIGVGPHLNLSVLYSSSAEQLSGWWTGFTDDISAISKLQIGLLSADTCQETGIDHMTTVVELTDIATDAKKFTFLGLQLQETLAYVIVLHVTNGAKLVRKAVSRPIVLDLVPPTAGSVADGQHFDDDIAFQHSTAEVHGTFIYLPSNRGDSCPLRRYSMTSPDADWQTLVHQYLYDVVEGKQDKVVFLARQLSYGADGLSLTLIRDNQYEQMLSAAVQADSDILKGGRYKFEVQAAGGGLRAVTAVTFHDGPTADVFADSTFRLFDGDKRSPVDDGKRPNGVQLIIDPIEGDTSTKGRGKGVTDSRSFGFQIHTNATDAGQTSHWLIMWTTKGKKTHLTETQLKFDPSQAFHTYELIISEDDSSSSDESFSDLELWVDGEFLVAAWGATSVSESTKVAMGVYSRHGWVAALQDPFSPPQTTAIFRNLVFPPAADNICRHGKLFRGGQNQIERFEASITKEKNGETVIPFRTVSSPCIACDKPCDAAVCSDSCAVDKHQVISFVLDGLNLLPDTMTVDQNGTARLQIYYLVVKGSTGSGQAVSSWSSGFYIDITPPFFQTHFHVDMAFSNQQPSSFQGDDTTIAVYFEVLDHESGIDKVMWAIGTTPGGTDIQPYMETDQENFAMNNTLEGVLLDKTKYYVSLKATNTAGLNVVNITEGVTIWLASPNVSSVKTEMEDTKPITASANAARSSRQDGMKLAWTATDEGETIETNSLKIGSAKGKSDIIPEQLVGVGNAGSVELSNKGLQIGASNDSTNLSDIRPRDKREIASQFYMERGRLLYIDVAACNPAHKCSSLNIKPIVIMGDDDVVGTPDTDGRLTLTLQPEQFSTQITVTSDSGQSPDTTLLGGILTKDDLRQEYKSDASASFKPIIVQPELTRNKTDRFLLKRIKAWIGPSFYLTSVPGQTIDGPLTLTVPFDKTKLKEDFEPRVVFWCAQEVMWIDAGRTCDDSDSNRMVDRQAGVITVKVCYGPTACLKASDPSARQRRATLQTGGAVTAAVASTDPNVTNNPPRITTAILTIRIFEEESFSVQLAAVDEDDDKLTFVLNPAFSPRGEVTLSYLGLLIYKPCLDCVGEDVIHFTVREQRTDGVPALSVDGEYKVVIEGVNDNPQLLLLVEGASALPPSHELAQSMEENQPGHGAYRDLLLLVAVSDPDPGDTLTLKMEPPSHGTLTPYAAVTTVHVVGQDCNSSWEERRGAWDAVLAAVQDDSVTSVVLPAPCGGAPLSRLQAMSWALTAIRYTPTPAYYGTDTIKVLGNDALAARSELLTITISVLRNPCLNGATCVGPASDPTCTSITRAEGFTGYSCGCVDGYSGSLCQTDVDDCAGSPCPTNYTCIDGLAGHRCHCDPTWPCAPSLGLALPAWQIALITVGAVIALVFLFVFMYCLFIRNRDDERKPNKFSNNSQEDSFYSTRGPFLSAWLHGRERRSYENPAFVHDYQTPGRDPRYNYASRSNDRHPHDRHRSRSPRHPSHPSHPSDPSHPSYPSLPSHPSDYQVRRLPRAREW